MLVIFKILLISLFLIQPIWATLTTTDLENHSDYNAGAITASAGANLTQANINGAGVGYEEGDQTTTTRSAISQGAITITNEAKQLELTGKTAQETLATLNHDTANAHTAVDQLPDLNTLLNEQQAMAGAMLTYSQTVPKIIGDFSSAKENTLREQANNETDLGKKTELQAQADRWAEGGVYRVGLHAIAGGLAGDIAGALGAGTSAATIPAIGEMINNTDLPSEVKQTLVALAGTAIGAAAGATTGNGGALIGGATGFNQTVNNYLSHGQKDQRAKQLESCQGNSTCVKAVGDYWNTIDNKTTVVEKIWSDVWSGLDKGVNNGVPEMWENTPWYAKVPLLHAGGIVISPVVEAGYWYTMMNPERTIVGSEIAADVLNPGVPSTMMGAIWNLYNEYHDYISSKDNHK